MGRRHAASWHGETPEGISETVNWEDYGVAAPINIPFGTKVKLTRIGAVNGEPSCYDGQSVIATVVDRMENYTRTTHFDAYPATARALGFGPYMVQDVGVVLVQVEIYD